LDWLSAARVDPVNDIVNKAIEAGGVVSLGYSPLLLASVLPFFVAYAILQHANVTWDFGPLKKSICHPEVSPMASYLGAGRARTRTSPGSCRCGIFFSGFIICRKNSRASSA
jgi:hypothetical protein